MKKIYALLLSILLIFPPGCGTLLTKVPFPVQGYEVPRLTSYPGTRLDIEAISEGGIYTALGVLDLPFSFAGDTAFILMSYPMGVVKIILYPWFSAWFRDGAI